MKKDNLPMKLIVLGNSSIVTQTDLENLLSLNAQISKMKRSRDRIAAGVLARIARGAQVEPGNRTYDIEEEFRGSTRLETLIVR